MKDKSVYYECTMSSCGAEISEADPRIKAQKVKGQVRCPECGATMRRRVAKEGPTTSLDVEVLLSEVFRGGAKKLTGYVEIYKEKDKPNCLVKVQKRMPRFLWQQINKQVRELGGKWSRKEELWIVPLQKRSETS